MWESTDETAFRREPRPRERTTLPTSYIAFTL